MASTLPSARAVAERERQPARRERLKLLFVYRFCGLGGVETSILNRLDALQGEAVEARVIFGEPYGSGGRSLCDDPRIAVGLNEDEIRAALHAADVVAIVDHPEFLDRLEGASTPPRVVFETHASFPPALARFYARLNDPRISVIAVPAEFNRRLVEAAAPEAAGKIVVIPNAVDASRFRPPLRGVSRHDPLLLWVGRLEKEKNPHEFIRIGAALLESGARVRMLMVGDGYSGEEYEAAAARLRTGLPQRWADRLTFRRAVPYPEMPALYAEAAESGGCLVSTSLYESAPMTFIEAMASMCPVVSSDVGGASELLGGGDAGRLYRSGDIAGAAGRIRQLLDPRRRAERQDIAERAHAVALRDHDPAAVAHRYRAMIDSIPGVVRGMVSVIIPVYNRAGLLREAVESVLVQTYRNFEIILVDDGSTDGTADFCDALARQQDCIRAVHTPHRGRAGLAREVGRQIARGEFIQYLDSDDLIRPEKLERMTAALEGSPECDIAYCATQRYHMENPGSAMPAARTTRSFDAIRPSFLTRRYWQTSTPLYRRRLLDKAGPWSDLPFWEDIEYDLRLAAFAPRLCHCEEWLTEIRDHNLGRLSGSRFLENPELLQHAVRGMALIYRNIKSAALPLDDRHVRYFIDDLRLMHNRCLYFGMNEAADECATIVMDATGCADRARVGEYTISAVLEPQVGALWALPNQKTSCPVRVTNRSTLAFHGGELATELAYHLRDASGAMLRLHNANKIFEEPLHPGESRLIDLPVYAPGTPGLYCLELDLLWAGLEWLNLSHGQATFVKLLVGESFGGPRWWLHLEDGATAKLEAAPDGSGARVRIHSAPAGPPWQVQANFEPLWVASGCEYELRFRARADRPRRLMASVSRTYDGWENLGLYCEVELTPEWRPFALPFQAAGTAERARVHFDAGADVASFEIDSVEVVRMPAGKPAGSPLFGLPARLQMDAGIAPLSSLWGRDRGLAIHRYYLECFLAEFASDIRGRCLEFQNPEYARRFGGAAVETLDILHLDGGSEYATLIADLTQPNDLPGNRFDCIVCTHVLHVILDIRQAVAELFRILKPDGVLLVAVPHISMYGPEYGEIWRFTPGGLETLLAATFGRDNVTVHGYGNSLTAAGEIRGLVSSEFLTPELNTHDPRFPVEVCARAVKRGPAGLENRHG